MPNRVKPTKRQVAAINGIMEGKSARRAMMDAGYSTKTSGNPKTKLLELRGVQAYISKFDEVSRKKYKMGLGDKLIDTYLDGLEATKSPDKSGNEHPDWTARSAFADKLSEFMGWNKQPPLQPQTAEYNQFNYFGVSQNEKDKIHQKLKLALKEIYKSSD